MEEEFGKLRLDDSLDPTNYRTSYEQIVNKERKADEEEFRDNIPDMLGVKLSVEPGKNSPLLLKVLNLGEDGGPNIRSGAQFIMCRSKDDLDSSSTRPKWSGYIGNVDKQTGMITLEVLRPNFLRYGDVAHVRLARNLYNIRILFPKIFFERCLSAIDRMVSCQGSSKILFPMSGDEIQDSLLESQGTNLQCISGIELDADQKKAIVNAMQAKGRPAPYLINGPPGTGKSTTLIELVLQIHKLKPDFKILVCSNSNKNADFLALRLLNSGKLEKGDLTRLIFGYRLSREADEHGAIPSELSEICVTSRNLEVYKIIVSSCTASDYFRVSKRDPFDFVIIDDATRSMEPECLIPMTLVKSNGCIVLFGDPHQSGPSIFHSDAVSSQLGQSLFERMSAMDSYSPTQANECRITKLRTCYRCDPRLMAISNKLFYKNEVECTGSSSETLMQKLDLQKPLVLHVVEDGEEKHKTKRSWSNKKEAKVCIEYVQKLQQAGYGSEQVGIVVSYPCQKEYIQGLLVDAAIENCIASKIESFQSKEREVMIVSTIRNQPGDPYLLNDRWFNECLTRARSLVIVVGDPKALQGNNWTQFKEEAQIVSAS